MKNITILGLILLGLSFSPLLTSADLPMGPGWHYVEMCAKITNLNEFPDMVFIGDYRDTTADGTKGFIINNNECIEGGYKFNTLAVGWISKNKLKSIDLNNLKIDSFYLPTDINILSKDVPFYIGELKDNTHIKVITTEYSIKQNSDDSISLNKSKEITEYNNGKSPKVETFSSSIETETPKNEKIIDKNNDQDNNQNQELPTPVKRGFWHSVLCFFGFSKYC